MGTLDYLKKPWRNMRIEPTDRPLSLGFEAHCGISVPSTSTAALGTRLTRREAGKKNATFHLENKASSKYQEKANA